METSHPAIDVESPCQACGACCSYSANWPRFTTEDDAALDLIPGRFVNERQSGMRCDGERCAALSGKIGVKTACTIYAVRPGQCRTWPFWDSNLQTPKDWEHTCTICPGSGHGDLIPVEEITRRLNVIKL